MSDQTEPTLTAREVEVLRLIALGHSSQRVADELSLSKRTIDDHLFKAYGKLGVSNRVQALHAAVRIGIVSEEAMGGSREP